MCDILNLLRVAIDAHHADDLAIDPQGHIAALFGAGITIQLIGTDVDHLSRLYSLNGTLMIGAYPVVFGGGHNQPVSIHDVDGSTTHQCGCDFYQLDAHFFQQHGLAS